MDVASYLNALVVVVACGVSAFLHLRNIYHHRHQAARRAYRFFLASVSICVGAIGFLVLVGILATPLPVFVGRNVVLALILCLIVVGYVEW